jgi:hypothetical protein
MTGGHGTGLLIIAFCRELKVGTLLVCQWKSRVVTVILEYQSRIGLHQIEQRRAEWADRVKGISAVRKWNS